MQDKAERHTYTGPVTGTSRETELRPILSQPGGRGVHTGLDMIAFGGWLGINVAGWIYATLGK